MLRTTVSGRTVRTRPGSASVSAMPVRDAAFDLLDFGFPGFPLSWRGSQAEHDNCVYMWSETNDTQVASYTIIQALSTTVLKYTVDFYLEQQQ